MPLDAIASIENAIGSSLISSLENAIGLPTPIAGWLAAEIGLDPSDPGTGPIEGQLKAISTQLDTLGNEIRNAVQTGVLNDDFTTLAPICSTISATAVKLPTETGTVLLNLLNTISTDDIGFLGTIGAIQKGTGGITGFLGTWIATFAPQFYIDAVQKRVIHDQFDYYQQMQFLMMDLLVEADHMIYPGQSNDGQIIPPTPPDYAQAVTDYNQYYDQVQQQTSLLPFQTKNLGSFGAPGATFGCEQVIYDRVTSGGVCWGTRNLYTNLQRHVNMEFIFNMLSMAESNGIRLPELAELEALGNVRNAGYEAAYKYIMGNEASSDPALQDLLNAFGFDLDIPADSPTIACPFPARQATVGSNWTKLYESDPSGPDIFPVGWYSDKFYDLRNTQQITVKFHCYRVSNDDPLGDLKTDNINKVVFVNPDGQTTGANPGYCLDGLYIYLLHKINPGTALPDPPIEEPSALKVIYKTNADGSIAFSAFGTFSRWVDESTGFQDVDLDITQFVAWSVPQGLGARISNVPAGAVSPHSPSTIGVLTWSPDASQGTQVKVTATRGSQSASATVTAPAGVLSPEIALNLYPRGLTFHGKPPLTGQVWVQRLNADGSTVNDDTANCKLSQLAPQPPPDYITFTDPTGEDGTFTIDPAVPPGKTTFTIQAQDQSGTKDSMDIVVIVPST